MLPITFYGFVNDFIRNAILTILMVYDSVDISYFDMTLPISLFGTKVKIIVLLHIRPTMPSDYIAIGVPSNRNRSNDVVISAVIIRENFRSS